MMLDPIHSPMPVWRCEEHDSVSDGDEGQCFWSWRESDWVLVKPCRLVEMHMFPKVSAALNGETE